MVLGSCKEPLTGPQISTGPIPPAFYLNQNFPNPFPDSTKIEYGVPSSGGLNSLVSIIVYDVFQREIRTLVNNSSHVPGTFSTTWDGLDVKGIKTAKGMYIIEMKGYTPQTTILRITAMKQ
jgi:hypothetical protein